jgi:hypothetical protein
MKLNQSVMKLIQTLMLKLKLITCQTYCRPEAAIVRMATTVDRSVLH